MWGVGFSLALAALLQGELGIDGERGAGENGVSQASDPPFARDETLPTMMANWTSDAPETGPPACRGKEDCPPWSSCEEDHVGRQICHCGLGYHLHPVFGCMPGLHLSQDVDGRAGDLVHTLDPRIDGQGHGYHLAVKVFPARLTVCNLEPLESSSLRVACQIRHLFQCILGHLEGYLDSPVHALNLSSREVTILHHFSARGPVTVHEVDAAVEGFPAQCHNGSLQDALFCDHLGTYQALNLCGLDVCDPLSTTCSSSGGLVGCTCRPGFFRTHVMDRTCTACESGFWLRNGTCVRCPFGFGGAACQDPLLLALVGVCCLAGLLLCLLLALLLFRRGPTSGEAPVALPLSLRSRVLSLPRVRPPGLVPEPEDSPPLALDPEREGPPAGGAPRMKTFLGSRGPPLSAPQTTGGCRNLVFIGDAGEPAERDHF